MITKREWRVSLRTDTESALDRIINLTKGYPCVRQEWGYVVWNVAAASPITVEDVQADHGEALKKIDGSFFWVRLERVTDAEKRYLRGLAELGPGDVQQAAPDRLSVVYSR